MVLFYFLFKLLLVTIAIKNKLNIKKSLPITNPINPPINPIKTIILNQNLPDFNSSEVNLASKFPKGIPNAKTTTPIISLKNSSIRIFKKPGFYI